MLIAFDANISPYLAKAISVSNISRDTNVEIIHVDDRYGQGIEDTTWIERFGTDGGDAFLSFDRHIRTRQAERQAYIAGGLKAIFIGSGWRNLILNQQLALLALKWPFILMKIQAMSAGDICELRVKWKKDGNPDSHFKNL